MTTMKKIKTTLFLALVAAFVVSGMAFSGVLGTPEPAFSQAPEPQCVCAECGHRCGSGHAKTCSSYRP
jgi:hypothetical protein